MSEGQIQALFSAIVGLRASFAELRAEIAETKRLVDLAAANSELIYQSYRSRGEAIENLQRQLERMASRCPLSVAPPACPRGE